jgi:hypothetical protein
MLLPFRRFFPSLLFPPLFPTEESASRQGSSYKIEEPSAEERHHKMAGHLDDLAYLDLPTDEETAEAAANF